MNFFLKTIFDCSTGRGKSAWMMLSLSEEPDFQTPRRPSWLELMGKIHVEKGTT